MFDNRRILYDAIVDSRKAQIFEIHKDDLIKILIDEGHGILVKNISQLNKSKLNFSYCRPMIEMESVKMRYQRKFLNAFLKLVTGFYKA
jgi:hypothetical protein